MTLIETLVSMAIAVGIVGTGIEATYRSVTRSSIARAETEAAIRAEALLARIGGDLPIAVGKHDGSDGGETHWEIDVRPEGGPGGRFRAYHVVATVSVGRGGRVATISLETLKLQPGKLR